MADLVSPIVDIISRLWTCCARHTKYLCKLQQNMILLRNAMDKLKDARNDVQRRVIEAEADPNEPNKRTDSVSGWLQNVETIEAEVEVILQKADEQLSSARSLSCLGGCCPPPNKYRLGKSIAKKIPLVVELKGKGHFEEVTYRLPIPYVQDMNLESTVGMESMFDEVWRLINSTDEGDKPVSNIIGLYGQGGVGKTTLLEKINNEFNKIRGFDIVMFVVVSKQLNYEAIQKKIGERLGLSLQGDEDEKSRAQKIFKKLRNKNYVLLLDDVWEEFDKKHIGIPIHPRGSYKLIFTTRSERVCGKMKADKKFKVECLPKDIAWRLFKENVGEEALNYFPDAPRKAKIIAEECDGLPLALIALGKAMSTKKYVQEWNDAIRTLRRYASEFKDMRDEVLPSLKMSYDYLDDETEKSCFRYCSLYPEDHSIEIAKLVDIWIAEGFLDGIDNLGAARDRGHTIIGSLKSACLLESWGEHHVKMHDVIRDLALWIVNDYSSTSTSDKFLVVVNDPCKKWENAERIFWDATGATTSSNNEEKKEPTSSPNLLTFIAQETVMSWPPTFFQHMPLLRVLDLSNTRLKDPIPTSICELHELQYLNLSGTDIQELPVELRKLVKLKFLILYDTYRLRGIRIPAGLIANLSELQVLDTGCVQNLKTRDSNLNTVVVNWELEDGPSFSELDGLKQLQEVHGIIISTDVALEKFLCSRKLQMVCTSLKFSSPHSSSTRRVLDLSNFKSLRDLKLIRGFSKVEELVLYGSITEGGLLSNLESLSLGFFRKLKSILWTAAEQPDLLHSHFQSLHYIWIEDCDALKDLTWLGYVQNLETLYVWSCTGLKTIIDYLGDDHGLEGTVGGGGGQMLNTKGGGGVFRRLKTLYMNYLPKLNSICRHALTFPSIESIIIHYCPELKKLPLDSDSNINNTLKHIGGRIEWWNELQWEDETIKTKFLPYLNKGYR